MWTCGRVHTKFWKSPEPYLNQGGGGQIMPTLYWCPHQVLKATGAPGGASGVAKPETVLGFYTLVCLELSHFAKNLENEINNSL